MILLYRMYMIISMSLIFIQNDTMNFKRRYEELGVFDSTDEMVDYLINK